MSERVLKRFNEVSMVRHLLKLIGTRRTIKIFVGNNFFDHVIKVYQKAKIRWYVLKRGFQVVPRPEVVICRTSIKGPWDLLYGSP